MHKWLHLKAQRNEISNAFDPIPWCSFIEFKEKYLPCTWDTFCHCFLTLIHQIQAFRLKTKLQIYISKVTTSLSAKEVQIWMLSSKLSLVAFTVHATGVWLENSNHFVRIYLHWCLVCTLSRCSLQGFYIHQVPTHLYFGWLMQMAISNIIETPTCKALQMFYWLAIFPSTVDCVLLSLNWPYCKGTIYMLCNYFHLLSLKIIIHCFTYKHSISICQKIQDIWEPWKKDRLKCL